MKTNQLILILALLLTPLIIFTQDIVFSYDETGNRILRDLMGEPLENTTIHGEETSAFGHWVSDITVTSDNFQSDICIAPNPSSGIYTIDLKNYKNINQAIFAAETGPRLVIQTTAGKLLIMEEHITSPFQVDISDSPDGVYFLMLSFKDQTRTWKLIKH